MTLQPVAPPHPLTVAEYLAIGEIEPGYSELVDGRLVMSPSPLSDHNWAVAELRDQLRPQLPEHLEIILDIDVDLELVAPDQPGFCRRPDLVVVQRSARRRQRVEGGATRASEVEIVVEVVSPSSKRTDYVHKRGEYADAGIPHYWIVDLDEPVSLLTCHLAGELGLADGGADGGEVTGTFRTSVPFPATVDLAALL